MTARLLAISLGLVLAFIPLLAEPWEDVFGGTELPGGWRQSVAGARRPAWAGTTETRFLRLCRAVGTAVPPRIADAAAQRRVGPPWLLPDDLLGALSLDGARPEPVEAMVLDEDGRGRKIPAMRVPIAIAVLDAAPYRVKGVSFTFVEEDGKPLSEADREGLTAAVKRLGPDHVLVAADRAASWQTVVSAIDAVREAACSEIRLARPAAGESPDGIRMNGVPLEEVQNAARPALRDHPALGRVIRAGRE